MGENFCFLFYPGDYLRDTQCLSEGAQVAYDRIICEHMRNICITQQQLNFFTKRLENDEKEGLLNVLEKSPGGYSIKWVVDSIAKRRSYSQSRAKNREGKKKKHMLTHEEDMNNISEHMEIEIEKEIKEDIGKGVQGERIGLWPDSDDLGMDIPEIKVGSVIQLISAAQQIHLTKDQVNQMWQAFKAQHFTGEKHYKSLNEIYSHFINWSKSQKIKDAKSASKTASGRSAGTVSYLERIAAEYAARGSGNDAG